MMNKIILIIVLIFISCEEVKQSSEEIKSEYIQKNSEYSEQVKTSGLTKSLIADQINYLQTIQLDTNSLTTTNIMAVKVETLKPVSIQDKVELTGKLEAYQEIDVQSSVSGKISQFKSNGAFVRAGDFIYKADASLYYQKFISARANLTQAEKSFTKWQNDIKTYQKLLKSNDISRDEFQNYEIQYLRSEQLMNAAKVSLEEAKLAYENAAFKAPFSGYVGNINLTVGQQINPGQQIARLADFSKLKVIVHLSVDEVQRFKKGDQAEFKSSSVELKGRIESISPIADSRTGTYLTRIAFANDKNSKMISGVFGKVTLFGKVYNNQFVIDQADIMDDAGQKYLYLVEASKTKRVNITESVRIGKRSIVLGDFGENDVYVTSGAGKLAANLEVNILE